jgi:hypothetical protein
MNDSAAGEDTAHAFNGIVEGIFELCQTRVVDFDDIAILGRRGRDGEYGTGGGGGCGRVGRGF